MLFQLLKQMAKDEGVTEALKRKDQMLWVQRMNSVRNRAEEIVLRDVILDDGHGYVCLSVFQRFDTALRID